MILAGIRSFARSYPLLSFGTDDSTPDIRLSEAVHSPPVFLAGVGGVVAMVGKTNAREIP